MLNGVIKKYDVKRWHIANKDFIVVDLEGSLPSNHCLHHLFVSITECSHSMVFRPRGHNFTHTVEEHFDVYHNILLFRRICADAGSRHSTSVTHDLDDEECIQKSDILNAVLRAVLH